MTRSEGRFERGKRIRFLCPHGHWRTLTMISSILLDGSTACMTIYGATDTETFWAYVREVLLPTLKSGDIVIMDNLTPPENEETLARIEAVGVSAWFLPAYSPDLNPSEKNWSKVEQALRSLEPRTHEELLRAIAHALSQVTPSDARNWFASCGYSIIQTAPRPSTHVHHHAVCYK